MSFEFFLKLGVCLSQQSSFIFASEKKRTLAEPCLVNAALLEVLRSFYLLSCRSVELSYDFGQDIRNWLHALYSLKGSNVVVNVVPAHLGPCIVFALQVDFEAERFVLDRFSESGGHPSKPFLSPLLFLILEHSKLFGQAG